MSSYYSCRLALVNPQILTEHAFCIVYRNVTHYNDPVTELPEFSPTDLTIPPEYFNFLNREHFLKSEHTEDKNLDMFYDCK